MKKTLAILIIILISIIAIYVSYMLGYKKGVNVNSINVANTQTEETCNTDQDCIAKGVVCDKADDQPNCMEINLATGEEYPEPRCVCLNPNLEY